jgi:hypothetical protein
VWWSATVRAEIWGWDKSKGAGDPLDLARGPTQGPRVAGEAAVKTFMVCVFVTGEQPRNCPMITSYYVMVTHPPWRAAWKSAEALELQEARAEIRSGRMQSVVPARVNGCSARGKRTG